MGNTHKKPAKPVERGIHAYALQFTLRMKSTDSLAYCTDIDTWIECIEEAMRFALELSATDSIGHVPVYNTEAWFECNEKGIYNMHITWASENCDYSHLLTTLQWYVEREIRRIIYRRYGVKVALKVMSLENMGFCDEPLTPSGAEARIRAFDCNQRQSVLA